MQAVAAHQGVLANSGGSSGVVAGQYGLISTGTQYIDSGWMADGAAEVALDVKYTTSLSTLYGVGSGANSNFTQFGMFNNNILFSWGTTAHNLGDISTPTYRHTYKRTTDGNFYIDDVFRFTGSGGDATSPGNFFLFASSDLNGNPTNIEAMTIYGLVGSSDSGTVNMWPVPQGMKAQGASSSTTSDIGSIVVDGIALSNCMYDADSDQYKENRGTGVCTVEAIPADVTPVTAGQYALFGYRTPSSPPYIDTLVMLKQEYDIEFNVRFDDASNLQQVFGSGTPDPAGVVRSDATGFVSTTAWDSYDSIGGSVNVRDLQFHTCGKSGTTFYCDSVSQDVPSAVISDATRTAYLFRSNGAGSAPADDCAFTTCKIWTDATRATYLVNMWAVPKGRTADGASSAALEDGMYNDVDGLYYYDATGLKGLTTEDLT